MHLFKLLFALLLFYFSGLNTSQAAINDAPAKPFGIVSAASGTGENQAVAEYYASMPKNTVYRPLNMPAKKLSIILWANGGCSDNGLEHGAFLREVASHNFIVIAAGIPGAERDIIASFQPLPDTENTLNLHPRPPSNRVPDATTPQQLIDGIEWLKAENDNPHSVLYQRANLAELGVMGHSCGGLQALVIAADLRVKTAVIFNSGVLNHGPDTGRSQIKVEKSALKKLHGPVAYINGGPTDIAYKNGRDDFQRIANVPAFFGENGVGHSGTFWLEPNGGEYAKIATAWMLWQLKGDSEYAKMFIGPDCILCTNSRWKVQQKNFEAIQE